jgi:hypothetical protein
VLRARLLGLFARLGRFACKLKSLATIAKDLARELKCVARKLRSLATMAKDIMRELKRLKSFWPDSAHH